MQYSGPLVYSRNLSHRQRRLTNQVGFRSRMVHLNNSAFQELYDFLREHRALERIQEILSPLRSPEELTIKTAECKEVNSWYTRENFKPTVTICYEFLKRILESLPNENNSDGLTPADAAVGQFIWVTLA